ncbi:MAG: HAD family hydrolase [Synechocystis sp.]|nr:HAD family hydrolase [Synechocystis sp.]
MSQKIQRSLLFLTAIAITLVLSFGSNLGVMAQSRIADPLPSWNDGQPKQTIIKFVEDVTDPNNSNYLPSGDRLAVFDNDGTLWLEKPFYVQLAFILDQIKILAPQHPEWQTQEPFKTLLTDPNPDFKTLATTENLLQLAMATHTGMTQTAFEEQVDQFFKTAKHPKVQKPYPELIYQPMVELIHYLTLNDFDVYICSGGGIDFIRAIAEEAYGIPPENVIGSAIYKTYQNNDFIRQPELVKPINDKAGKPVNIDRYIGKIPAIAVGNSDGDIEMLQYTDSNPKANLELLLHHDDADREFDYDHGTEKALVLAKENDWIVISIKQDFKQVFPHD